jgi:hypothetical protein
MSGNPQKFGRSQQAQTEATGGDPLSVAQAQAMLAVKDNEAKTTPNERKLRGWLREEIQAQLEDEGSELNRFGATALSKLVQAVVEKQWGAIRQDRAMQHQLIYAALASLK